jgi:hypothetical protein
MEGCFLDSVAPLGDKGRIPERKVREKKGRKKEGERKDEGEKRK